MKILILIHEIKTLGGAQRVTSVLANDLSNRYDVDILCVDSNKESIKYPLNGNVNLFHFEDLKCEFYYRTIFQRGFNKINSKYPIFDKLKMNFINKYTYYSKQNRKALINFINEKKYDIVIGSQGEMAIYLALIKNKINSKIVGWQHNCFMAYFDTPSQHYYVQRNLYKKTMKKFDEYVVLTQGDKTLFKKNWNTDVICIPNIRSFTSNDKSSLTSKVFFAMGRFEYVKNFSTLIKAFYEVQKECDYKLVLLGSGSLQKEYEELIKSYNIEDNVEIHNHVNDVKPYLMNCCSLVMPSHWEGLPMVMLEAFEMGLPVISFDISAVEGILIDGKNGFICKQKSVESLAQTMINYTKIENLLELQKNCIETSNEFSTENVICKWFDLIDNL